MNIDQYKTQLQMRTPIGFSVRFGNTTRAICLLLWILFFTAIAPCIVVSQINTNEQEMNTRFQRRMHLSETIVDAQVISIESRYLDSSDARSALMMRIGRRAIYTTIKFKVYQTIKGQVQNNEFAIDQEGGQIGNIIQSTTGESKYKLNDRAIWFLRKDENGRMVIVASVKIHRFSGLGAIQMKDCLVGVDSFINIIQQSIADTTAFRKYYLNREIENNNLRTTIAKKKLENGVKQDTQRNDTTSNGSVK